MSINVVSSDYEISFQVEEAPKMLTLVSSDNWTFQVEEAVAKESQMIKFMIEDECGKNTIPIPNVTSRILAMVIEHCKRHVEFTRSDQAAEKTDALKKFDKEFVNVDKPTLFELILAANYLNIRSLLDLTCQETADRIKKFSPAEVREFFNIENDFTPDEEAEVRRENAWAFE